MLFSSYIKDFLNLMPSRQKQKQKEEIRATLQQRRRILTKEVVAQSSAEVVQQLRHNSLFQSAKNILVYYPVKNEIDLRPLFELEPQKTFLLPVVHRRSLEVKPYRGEENIKRGKLGIPEPQGDAFKGNIDLIIVPAVGYDDEMHRIGRGGGYYDRFLKQYRRVPKIGVGYKFQKVHKIPVTKHDEKVTELCLAKTA